MKLVPLIFLISLSLSLSFATFQLKWSMWACKQHPCSTTAAGCGDGGSGCYFFFAAVFVVFGPFFHVMFYVYVAILFTHSPLRAWCKWMNCYSFRSSFAFCAQIIIIQLKMLHSFPFSCFSLLFILGKLMSFFYDYQKLKKKSHRTAVK